MLPFSSFCYLTSARSACSLASSPAMYISIITLSGVVTVDKAFTVLWEIASIEAISSATRWVPCPHIASNIHECTVFFRDLVDVLQLERLLISVTRSSSATIVNIRHRFCFDEQVVKNSLYHGLIVWWVSEKHYCYLNNIQIFW